MLSSPLLLIWFHINTFLLAHCITKVISLLVPLLVSQRRILYGKDLVGAMKFIAALSFVAVLAPASSCQSSASAVVVAAAPAATAACRALPGDAAYPPVSDWNALNNTLGGRLIATAPPLGSVCHDPTYNATKCAAYQAQWQFAPIQ